MQADLPFRIVLGRAGPYALLVCLPREELAGGEKKHVEPAPLRHTVMTDVVGFCAAAGSGSRVLCTGRLLISTEHRKGGNKAGLGVLDTERTGSLGESA